MRAAEEWVEDNFIGVLTTVMTVTILQVVDTTLASCLTRHVLSFCQYYFVMRQFYFRMHVLFFICMCFSNIFILFFYQCLCVIVLRPTMSGNEWTSSLMKKGVYNLEKNG